MNTTTAVATAPQPLTPDQIDQITGIVQQSVNGMIQIGQTRAAKALAASERILSQVANIPVSQITDEEDRAIAVHLKKVDDLKSALEGDRKPLTAAMDQIRSQFTAIEASLTLAKMAPDAPTAKLVKIRNDRAAFMVQKQREEEQKRAVEAGKSAERVSIKADIELQVSNRAIDYVTEQVSKMTAAFNSSTLENLSALKDTLQGWDTSYPRSIAAQVKTQVPVRFLDNGEVVQIISDLVTAGLEKVSAEVTRQLDDQIESFMDRIASRKAELQEIENAGKAERAKLKKEQEEREKAEAADQAAKALAQKEQVSSAVKTDEAISQAQIQFDTMAVSANTATNAKEDVELRVDSVAGWMEILKYYVKNVAPGLSATDLEKKLGFMRKDAEKHFKKSGEKIVHKDVHYIPVVSAGKAK